METGRRKRITRRATAVIAVALTVAVLSGCQTMKPIHTVDRVDLARFMGDWYVIAGIPTSTEKDAYNAVESYHLKKDGSVGVTYKFNQGGLDGPMRVKTYRGFIRDNKSNAVWDYQIVWPFKAEYRIIHLDADYSRTVIGRSKRDYVWIMARKPFIPNGDYEKILKFLVEQGYSLDGLRKVPHGSIGEGG